MRDLKVNKRRSIVMHLPTNLLEAAFSQKKKKENHLHALNGHHSLTFAHTFLSVCACVPF